MYRQLEKKLVKQQYLLHIFPQYGELRPTSGWDRFGSLGTPATFNGFRVLALLTAATSFTGGQPKFARCLPSSGLLYTIYTRSGALAPWRNFATCKIHFASKSCVLLHWQRYCTALQQQASAKLRRGARNRITELSQRAPPIFGWAAITLGIGPHSSSIFFPRLISAVADWMSAIYFHTWCGLSANLECRSEMRGTRLAGN